MVQNHVKEKEFVKGELTDLVHARLTNWGLIIVAILAVVTFLVFSALPPNVYPYISIRAFAGEQQVRNIGFFQLAFGAINNESNGENIGAPNPILLTEYALFIIAAVLPVFFKKHVKKALTVSSIIFIVLSLFLFVNWSQVILVQSFNPNLRQAFIGLWGRPLENHMQWMHPVFPILAVLPIATLFIQWVALAIEEKRATKKLVNDFKFGKKLLNY